MSSTFREQKVVISAAFIDDLIKLSEDADQILIECGRIRLQRAIQEAVGMYIATTWKPF